ncbi:MAG: hypothetical protein U0939_04055 [Pirellulales bacterium]
MHGIRIVLSSLFVVAVLGTWYGVTRVMLLDHNADVGEQPWLFADSPGALYAVGLGLTRTLPLALPLAATLWFAARLGPWPKLDARVLHRPLFGVVSAAVAGGGAAAVAALLISERHVWLTGVNTARLTDEARDWLLADLWFREGFLMAGGFGLFLLAQAAIARRMQLEKQPTALSSVPTTSPSTWNALRFSMRTFLFLMLGAALVFGVAGRRVQYAATQQRLLSNIRARGVELRPQRVARVDSLAGERIDYTYLPAVVLSVDRDVAYEDLLRTLQEVPHILQLDVVQPSLDERFWEALLRHEEIGGLRIVSPAVRDEHVERLGRLPHLKRLSLDGCPVTDAVVPGLIRHGDWEGLSFRATRLSPDGLDQLRSVTWPDRFIGWPVAISEHQQEFSRLLGAGATIHSGPNGGEFHLSVNGPEADMTSLAALPIESVRVRNRRLTDVELQRFAQMPKLRSLQLHDCPLTREGFERVLSLVQLEDLGLASCNVSDDDLARLQRLPRLASLGLGGERITDASVERLEQLPTLRKITLWPTAISESRLARWRLARPDLQIDVRSVGP